MNYLKRFKESWELSTQSWVFFLTNLTIWRLFTNNNQVLVDKLQVPFNLFRSFMIPQILYGLARSNCVIISEYLLLERVNRVIHPSNGEWGGSTDTLPKNPFLQGNLARSSKWQDLASESCRNLQVLASWFFSKI